MCFVLFLQLQIPVEIQKEAIVDENGQPKLDERGKPIFYSGFSIGGGIDQDHNLSPQQYPDNVINFHYLKNNFSSWTFSTNRF
jgi:hypothetical protein